MPTFETPEPIAVRIEAGDGSIRLIATDRADTVVEVRPRDESRSSDVWAAEHTRVDFRDGKLVVSGAKRGLPLLSGRGHRPRDRAAVAVAAARGAGIGRYARRR